MTTKSGNGQVGKEDWLSLKTEVLLVSGLELLFARLYFRLDAGFMTGSDLSL